MKNKTKGMLYAIFACVTWSTIWIAGKYLIDDYHINAFLIAFIRFLTAAVVLLAYIAVKSRRAFIQSFKKHFLLSVVLGASGIFGMGSLVFLSLQYTTVGNAGILMNSNTLIIFLLSMFIGEKFTGSKIAGVILGMLGCYLIINKGLAFDLFNSKGLRGDLFSLGAAVCWAIYTVVGKKYIKDADSLHLSAMNFLTGSAMLFLLVLFTNGWQGDINLKSLGLLVYIGAIPTALGFLAWYIALEHLEAGATGIFQIIVPLLIFIMAYFLFNEIFTFYFAAGVVFVLAGICFVTLSK
jgi:drug/metabolite transporter (DMT)-like permease